MLEKITENIHLVKGKNKGFFPFSNSILITPGVGDATLIDTGSGIEILRELKKKFKIVGVINSHTHPDHSAGNWLFDGDGVSITVPKEGFETAGNIVKLSERLAEPGELAKYWREWVSAAMNFKDRRPDGWFNAESTIEIGNIVLKPIYTPGHTIDHYCLYEPKNKILFAFDYDLTRFGPWYGHRESDIVEFKDSIKRIMELDIEVFVSGHKGIIRDNIKGRLEEFLKKFDLNEKNILALLAEGPKTVEELVELAPIYGSFPYAEPLLRYWEGNMIGMHLDQLIEGGRVTKRNDGLYSAS
ncbi:MAG: MBL fold metallo-hydrolase [Deltaproteobacteria bacterium]|uniref:MBL fold metallo-hydrolase n=1 Tax=Candidatus Zymogenus saltonus TaxID=2844893 RepID=A0A9D8KCS4_9DELT|nr:MBL fold metallo-hydrolase [Candidatus Zymogenus saltonus]